MIALIALAILVVVGVAIGLIVYFATRGGSGASSGCTPPCLTGQTCNEGQCLEQCKTNTDCTTSGTVCRNNVCVEGCSQNTDCSTGLCQDGVCASDPCSKYTNCSEVPSGCGFCFDNNVGMTGTSTGPTYGKCNKYNYGIETCAAAQKCANLNSCADISGTSCGWCFDNGGFSALGNSSGSDVNSGVCNSWMYESDDCTDASVCAGITACPQISGTDCVFCTDSGISIYGIGPVQGPKYPTPGNCQGDQWIWFSSQCPS